MWLLLLLFGIGFEANAQSVEGKWYGIGRVQIEDASDNYMSELILKQIGKQVKGTFNYYFKDQQKSIKIEGSFDKSTRILSLKSVPVIFYKSNNTRKSVESLMNGRFELRVSRTESLLNGVLASNIEYQYMVPNIKFRFLRSSGEPVDTAVSEAEPAFLALDKTKDIKPIPKTILETRAISNEQQELAKKETLKVTNNKIELTKTASIAPKVISIPAIVPLHPIKLDTLPIIETRQKNYIREILLDNDLIKVEIYDNGTIDFDSVSLYLNGKEVLAKTVLNHRSIKVTLQIDPTKEFNELSMFAENLGMIPPNTAAMIVHDGQKEYQLLLQSDFSKSATLKLKVRKPNP